MKYRSFAIANFRGIQNLRLELPSDAAIITLVGLNESGKTTILEAINYFKYNPENLDALNIKGYGIKDPHALIPISKKSNFNGVARIEVVVDLEEEDKAALKKFFAQVGATLGDMPDQFTIEQKTAFSNSRHDPKKSTNIWDIHFPIKKKGQRTFREARGDAWLGAVNELKSRLPSIIYFPTFSLDLPEKIYLENAPTDDRKHEFYRQVLQDILDSLGTSANVATHLVARLKSTDPHDKASLDGLLLDMGRSITRSVFQAWNRIFHKNPSAKRVVLHGGVDEDSGGARPYIQFRIEDTDGYFYLEERSVGFRWFFSFLLLTQFRVFRKGSKSALFLFDEPASNLHPTAQTRLLESLPILLDAGSVVYTTHSQHLINVDWLGTAYVVKNDSAPVDADAIDGRIGETAITAAPYARFVNEHSDQSYFFKPILDVLDYVPTKLEAVSPAVLTEGRSDFFALRLHLRSASGDNSLCFMPGMGAGSLDTLIRLYVGWSRPFVVLLDSDQEGQKQRNRYLDKFGPLVDGRVFCLEDIDQDWRGFEIEDVISEADRARLGALYYAGEKRMSKKAILNAMQRALTDSSNFSFGDETNERLARIVAFLAEQLEIQAK